MLGIWPVTSHLSELLIVAYSAYSCVELTQSGMFSTHFYTVLALCSTQATSQETETALTQRLLQDYVLSARPVKNVSLIIIMVFRIKSTI